MGMDILLPYIFGKHCFKTVCYLPAWSMAGAKAEWAGIFVFRNYFWLKPALKIILHCCRLIPISLKYLAVHLAQV